MKRMLTNKLPARGMGKTKHGLGACSFNKCVVININL